MERQVVGESTRRNYEGFILNHLGPCLGRKTLAGLARRDFEEFAKDLHVSGEGLAVSTVNDRMVRVAALMEVAVVDKRITENPARGIRISRRDAVAVDEDAVPAPAEVELIAAHVTPSFRLAVHLQSGTGQRPSEALAFSTERRRSGFVRIRWQVSAKAHREDCRTPFVRLKHRLEKECRDIRTALFVEQEIDTHLRRWKPVPVAFTGRKGKRIRLETFFAPHQPGTGVMPSIASYGHQFKKACLLADLVDLDGKVKYTPRSLRHFLRLHRPGKRCADPRGVALAGAPFRQDDGRYLRASAARHVGALPGSLAALHAARAPGRDVPTVRGGELERRRPSCGGVPRLAGLRGSGIGRPCWDGAGMPTVKTAFPQVGALHYRFRFNV
ncbi:hypothetical protein [Streptomyces sp. NPDC088915]|uniref:hypothetical protein n=1 Tax=Streptomyces sp. NPDC088915 TaxID=3365912 RepID=UPI0038259096